VLLLRLRHLLDGCLCSFGELGFRAETLGIARGLLVGSFGFTKGWFSLLQSPSTMCQIVSGKDYFHSYSVVSIKHFSLSSD
jgi:hypothetical protein